MSEGGGNAERRSKQARRVYRPKSTTNVMGDVGTAVGWAVGDGEDAERGPDDAERANRRARDARVPDESLHPRSAVHICHFVRAWFPFPSHQPSADGMATATTTHETSPVPATKLSDALVTLAGELASALDPLENAQVQANVRMPFLACPWACVRTFLPPPFLPPLQHKAIEDTLNSYMTRLDEVNAFLHSVACVSISMPLRCAAKTIALHKTIRIVCELADARVDHRGFDAKRSCAAATSLES